MGNRDGCFLCVKSRCHLNEYEPQSHQHRDRSATERERSHQQGTRGPPPSLLFSHLYHLLLSLLIPHLYCCLIKTLPLSPFFPSYNTPLSVSRVTNNFPLLSSAIPPSHLAASVYHCPFFSSRPLSPQGAMKH